MILSFASNSVSVYREWEETYFMYQGHDISARQHSKHELELAPY